MLEDVEGRRSRQGQSTPDAPCGVRQNGSSEEREAEQPCGCGIGGRIERGHAM